MKRSISLLILPFAFAAMSVSADYSIDKRFDVKKNGLLELHSDRGQIELSSHDKNEILVKVDVNGKNADDFDVKIEEVSNGLEIKGDYDGSHNFWGKRLKVKYTIVVPTEFNINARTAGGNIRAQNHIGTLELKTSGGGINVRDLEGQLIGHTSGGSISVADIDGDTDIRTSGGSINGKDLVGELDARTSGGSINLHDIDGDTVVRTSGGSINIGDFSGDGSLEARTSGGSVNADITSAVKGDISMKTSGGSVTLHVPSSDYNSFSGEKNKRYVEGKINNTQVSMKTSGGRTMLKSN